jgi:hypothetical protein
MHHQEGSRIAHRQVFYLARNESRAVPVPVQNCSLTPRADTGA